MREIKFRGKRIDSNEWVFFSLHDLAMNVGTVRAFGLVRTDTISQYTGLKDKNGKEIYEGDIVEFYEGYDGMEGTYQVVWGNAAFWLTYLDGTEADWEWHPFSVDDPHAFEVVGNIYENPELLKES